MGSDSYVKEAVRSGNQTTNGWRRGSVFIKENATIPIYVSVISTWTRHVGRINIRPGCVFPEFNRCLINRSLHVTSLPCLTPDRTLTPSLTYLSIFRFPQKVKNCSKPNIYRLGRWHWFKKSQRKIVYHERIVHVYPDAVEDIPSNMPEPFGRSIQINAF